MAPPPLTRLRIDPPQVESLIFELANVCTSVYVTVSAAAANNYTTTTSDLSSSSSSSSAAVSSSSRPPYYRVRVYGKWPKRGSMRDGGATVCEIELNLDGWLRGREEEVEKRSGGEIKHARK